MAKDYYRQKPKRLEFLWKRDKDGTILLRMMNSQFLISLGPMGTDVYERCNAKTTMAEIIEFVKNKYSQIPAQEIEHDIYQFVHWLETLGLLLVYWDDF